MTISKLFGDFVGILFGIQPQPADDTAAVPPPEDPEDTPTPSPSTSSFTQPPPPVATPPAADNVVRFRKLPVLVREVESSPSERGHLKESLLKILGENSSRASLKTIDDLVELLIKINYALIPGRTPSPDQRRVWVTRLSEFLNSPSATGVCEPLVSGIAASSRQGDRCIEITLSDQKSRITIYRKPLVREPFGLLLTTPTPIIEGRWNRLS